MNKVHNANDYEWSTYYMRSQEMRKSVVWACEWDPAGSLSREKRFASSTPVDEQEVGVQDTLKSGLWRGP
jgi:hypothetical protein